VFYVHGRTKHLPAVHFDADTLNSKVFGLIDHTKQAQYSLLLYFCMAFYSVYRLALSTILAKQTALAVFTEFIVLEEEAISIFPEYYRKINGKSRNTKRIIC
jgi:hypothetical protein